MKPITVLELGPVLRKAGLIILAAVVIFVLNVWLLASLAAGILNSWYGVVSAFGRTPPEIPGASWYLTHPLQVSKAFLLHIFGWPLSAPQVFSAWLVLNGILVALAAFIYIARRYRLTGRVTRETAHGTARWLSPWEARKYLSYGYGPGLMFGRAPGVLGRRPAILKPDAPGNRNIAVFGPPGSRKSSNYICNNLFQAVINGWSVIVTDPKGELVRTFRRWFEKKGYVVKVFNLVEMLHSDRWNSLAEVTDDISAQHFCNVVIANTSVPGRKGGDPFWDRAEMNLLKALVLYVVKELPHSKTLGTLYQLLACGDSKALDKLFEGLPLDHPARLPYNLFCETSGTVRTGVIIGLGTRLEVFQNRLVRELTAGNDIDLELPGREKCAYFCVLSDTDSTFNFLASLFFTFLFIKLTRLADRQREGRLDVPVHFLLDEFCNISGIPDFTKKISTMRGRGIGCSVIFQNIPQLMHTYPDRSWEIIIGDCDYWLILGAREKTSAEYVSSMLGSSTIEVESDSRPKGLEGAINPWAGRLQMSPTKRPLMDVSEVSRLASDELILRFADGQIIKLKKMYYKDLPWAKELEPEEIQAYEPEWARRFIEFGEFGDGAGHSGSASCVVPGRPIPPALSSSDGPSLPEVGAGIAPGPEVQASDGSGNGGRALEGFPLVEPGSVPPGGSGAGRRVSRRRRSGNQGGEQASFWG